MALTKYKEGSLRELWALSVPLMLSSFSVMSMLFIDRLLLARYSAEALNAAVNATTLGWSIIYGWLVLASIAEVFVAQYNGAGQKEKLGEPVWQMIWLGAASFFCFIPLAWWGGDLIYGGSSSTRLEREYFGWMILFGPSFPLYAALCGFFVGQGKTRLITLLAFVANVINAFLDVALIFGVDGWVPSLGVTGAAIATSGSSVFQVVILGFIFLNKQNREQFGTADYHFKWESFLQCVKVGFPSSVFVAVEILGWAAFYWMMTKMGEKYITIAGICQSVSLLFYFFGEGISKAAAAISGNLIGAKNIGSVPRVFSAGVKLHLIFFGFLMLLYFFFSDFIVGQFMREVPPEKATFLQDSMMTGLLCIFVYMLFEGIRLLLAGLLTASGDTFFLLIAGTTSVWGLLVLPIYYFVVLGGSRVEIASFFCVFYSCAACLIYLWRFVQGNWKTISITSA